MVEKDVLEEKINERKEKFEEKKETVGEKVDSKYNEKKEKFDEKKEKGKVYSEKFVNDLNTTIDEFKDNLKNMQKYADEKINEYKNATISNLAVDLIESDDIYYLKVAVPGLDKDEVEIEAGDNDIVITATFKPFIEELEDIEDARVIASELTVGKCSKTVRFENSIEIEKIKAKYKTGVILITIPKLIIPKHKVTVE
ncbi:MAG: Hsp20/alpha crystallin family protein [Methanobrevibacter sp.]|uniref:Hsp20/alpha crystallin family protein n=1 Tax=Methanobrevibacter millerae TaxID=230361 RepID=A0A8T3VCU7_9EURY|nr:Hsp20/alpha crystallin family protein [Methanobrevibacter millerae]MBE6504982.1 Hsp20/alpha crystallin family protein [Methanobrevibacter millerae]MBR0369817.1 Hsp20/alpha crystallin family protein [Methanobrevibacter sp.]